MGQTDTDGYRVVQHLKLLDELLLVVNGFDQIQILQKL